MKDIIIVEDGRAERERLFKLFSDSGYSVSACENVSEAEKLLQHEDFRLAVLDIGLADRSGSYLFNSLKRQTNVSYIIIFTGNPSAHLKQRFLDEGAADYIVKGSPQAQSDALLTRVREIIGETQTQSVSGIDLEEFLSKYVTTPSKQLFLDSKDSLPQCAKCGSRRYIVSFTHKTQIPPEIHGKVVCAGCAQVMDPKVE